MYDSVLAILGIAIQVYLYDFCEFKSCVSYNHRRNQMGGPESGVFGVDADIQQLAHFVHKILPGGRLRQITVGPGGKDLFDNLL